jgi:membrane protein
MQRQTLPVPRALWQAAISDRISLVSAGCAFYALLALFPALSLIVNIYGLFFDVRTVEPQLEWLRDWLPETAFALIAERIHLLVTTPRAALGTAAAMSLALALWSSGAGVRAMIGALNMANRVTERRGFFAYQATAFGITLGTLLLVVLGIFLLVAWPRAVAWLRMNEVSASLVRWGSLAILVFLVVTALSLLYRFGPSRPLAGRPRIWPGVIAATLFWALALLGFGYYVANFAGYDATYGTLGTAVALLMWMFVSVFAVLLGAELNAVMAMGRPADRP